MLRFSSVWFAGSIRKLLVCLFGFRIVVPIWCLDWIFVRLFWSGDFPSKFEFSMAFYGYAYERVVNWPWFITAAYRLRISVYQVSHTPHQMGRRFCLIASCHCSALVVIELDWGQIFSHNFSIFPDLCF